MLLPLWSNPLELMWKAHWWILGNRYFSMYLGSKMFWFALVLYLSNMKALLFYFIFFFLTLGPPLPIGLHSFSMLEIQGDLFVFGGFYYTYHYNSAIYQLSCSSGNCRWSEFVRPNLTRSFGLNPILDLIYGLKLGRTSMEHTSPIVIPVADSLCT